MFRAIEEATGAQVAVKLLVTGSENVRARLAGEFSALQSLDHPNVVRSINLVQGAGVQALVMELVEGPTLSELLESGSLTEDQRYFIADGLLDGVRAAHAVGLVHRDLKPSNVVCLPNGSGYTPKIVDFGLVKNVDQVPEVSAADARYRMGTPQYMAPEQVCDTGAVDHRADVFALGGILYELATGAPAFVGDAQTIFASAAAGTFVRPCEMNPDLPKFMEIAIVGALQPQPGQRIPDVTTLQELWRGQMSVAHYALPSVTLAFEDPNRADRYKAAAAAARRRSTLATETSEDPRSTFAPSSPVVSPPAPIVPTPPLPPAPAGLSRVQLGGLVAVGVIGVALVGVLVLAVVGTGVLGASRSQPPPSVGVVPVAVPEVVAPPPSSAPLAPSFHVESTPTGAVVRRGGVIIGNTPLDLRVDETLAGQLIQVEADGYTPSDVLVLAEGGAISVPLAAVVVPEPVQTRKKPVGVSKPKPVEPKSETKAPEDPLLNPWGE